MDSAGGRKDLPVPKKHLSFREACKALGYGLSDPTIIICKDEAQQDGLRDWVSYMTATERQEQPTSDWWLFHSCSQDSLRTLLAEAYLGILRLTCDSGEVLWVVDDKSIPMRGKSWIIAVEDPRNAIHAALSISSLDDAARWMVSWGTPIDSVHLLPQRWRTLVFVLQWRQRREVNILKTSYMMQPPGFVFNVEDFAAYENYRWFMLSSPRVGRAAMLSGGILWRLAVEDAIPDVVLDGPLCSNSHGAFSAVVGGKPFVDDALTEDEISVLIGTYLQSSKIPGQCYKKNNATLLMWWPTLVEWNKSSLHSGFWSPQVEDWYCGVRDKYCRGVETPKTNAHGTA